jgi:Rrf2 family protein
MQLTEGCKYALYALTYLARKGLGVNCQTSEVADACCIPAAYLSKILQALARRGLLASQKGFGGGVCLLVPPGRISVRQVMEAVQRPFQLIAEATDDQVAAVTLDVARIHELLRAAQDQLLTALDRITIADFAHRP